MATLHCLTLVGDRKYCFSFFSGFGHYTKIIKPNTRSKAKRYNSIYFAGSKCIKHTLRPETDDSDENDPVGTLQWDPLSIDYLLVANAGSGVRLVDSVSQSVIMTFHCPSAAAKVCTVSWLTNAPGMFITGGK